jgi:hypothetical protein
MLIRHRCPGLLAPIAILAAIATPVYANPHTPNVASLVSTGNTGSSLRTDNVSAAIKSTPPTSQHWSAAPAGDALTTASSSEQLNSAIVESASTSDGRQVRTNSTLPAPEFSTVAMLATGSGGLLMQLARQRRSRRIPS